MRIMTNYTTRSGKLVPFLVVLAVLTGCQSGPTEVQDTQNIEEQRRDAKQEEATAQALSGGEGEEQQQAEVASTPATAPSSHTAVVSAATWTDGEWPLTIEEGTLSCQGAGAVFITDRKGRVWPVNGMASAWRDRFDAQPDLEPIWREDEKLMETFPEALRNSDLTLRIDIGPLIKRGLSLCD